MSGRGLGFTGGTIDKLESINGFRTSIGREEFFKIINEIGLSVIGQSGNICPADKKIYALRDVTATVDNIPLIAASIMSKKLAAGSNCILLDVKFGSGAFMKSLDDSIKLAKAMVNIGENSGKKTAALITNMNVPLGNAVGNSLEVIEAVNTLKGNGPKDLTEICIALSAAMLNLAGKGSIAECENLSRAVINNGGALVKLLKMVKAQGGDEGLLLDTGKFEKAAAEHETKAEKSGFISSMDVEKCGIASALLGAGRETKDDKIDYTAGIILKAKTGDFVNKGDTLAVFYTNKREAIADAEKMYKNAVSITDKKPETQPLIYARVDINGVHKII